MFVLDASPSSPASPCSLDPSIPPTTDDDDDVGEDQSLLWPDCAEAGVESGLTLTPLSSFTLASILSLPCTPADLSSSKNRTVVGSCVSIAATFSLACGLVLIVCVLLSQSIDLLTRSSSSEAAGSQPSSAAAPLPCSTSPSPLSLSAAASVWPFSSANRSVAQRSWISLLSSLYGVTAEVAIFKEAAFVSDHAVASLSDLLDLTNTAPPLHYQTCEQTESINGSRTSRRGEERQRWQSQLDRRVDALDLHISSAPTNEARRQQLDRQLKRQGFASWTYHTRWNKQLMLKERQLVAQWMHFPAGDNSTALLDSINYSHLNYLEHMDMLSTIAEANSSSLSLILEDDVVVTPFFRQRMAWLASVVPDTATTVFFGGCLNIHPALREVGEQISVAAADPSTSLLSDSCSGFMLPKGTVTSCRCVPHRPAPLLVPQTASRCASGYLMSARGAARIVAAVKRMVQSETAYTPFDWILNRVFTLIQQDDDNTPSVYMMEPPASYEIGKILNQAAT